MARNTKARVDQARFPPIRMQRKQWQGIRQQTHSRQLEYYLICVEQQVWIDSKVEICTFIDSHIADQQFVSLPPTSVFVQIHNYYISPDSPRIF